MDMSRFKTRIIYTKLLFMGHFTFGITSALYGPSLVDLAFLLNNDKNGDSSSTELGPVSLFFTFFCGGCISGAFFTGLYKYDLTRKYLNRQLLLSIFIMMASVFHSFIPQITTIGLFYVSAYGSGFGLGTYNAASTTWFMEMWSGKRLASILQAAQFMYGLGSIVSPGLVKPFLHGYSNNSQESKETKMFIDIDTRRHDLIIPYSVSGSLEFAIGALLFGLFFLLRYHLEDLNSDNNNEERNSSSQSSTPIKLLDHHRHRTKRLMYHIIMTLIFASYNLAEIGFSSFQNTYFQEQKVSAKDSADLALIESAAYTFGRLANVLITTLLSISVILYGHLSLTALGFIGLYLIQSFGHMKLWLLMANCTIIGYAKSAINPALFGFTSIYTKVDDRHNSIYYIALGLPMLFAPFIIGPNIHRMPNIVLHMALGPVLTAMFFYICIKIIIRSAK